MVPANSRVHLRLTAVLKRPYPPQIRLLFRIPTRNLHLEQTSALTNFSLTSYVRANVDRTNPNDYVNVRTNKSDVTNILKAIAEFSINNTMFLLTRPIRGNEMSAIACDVAVSSQQRTKH
jgi:hypothetical protein